MKKFLSRKARRRLLLAFIFVFITANIIAAMQAWKFTHYSPSGVKTESIHLTLAKKLELLFTGIDNPRPVDSCTPTEPYTTEIIKSNVDLSCWYIPTRKASPRGTVLLFHGYTGCKAQLIRRAEPFLQNGYNCLLVDFMGSGGSGGNGTTVGFKEADEVSDCFQFIQQKGEKNIYLYGSSMGAVAIMKAIQDDHIQPKSIIIECPFATMYETVAIRFRNLGIPTFPMAGILLFWGSVENGFWGFAHNPETYAKSIQCPTLLQYGEKDIMVARSEIDRIYKNLVCPKKIIIYPQAGHDDYEKKCGSEWSNNMIGFLNAHN